jgi:hypothetical protein
MFDVKSFTAMAKRITPKTFWMIPIPFFPRMAWSFEDVFKTA